MQIRFSKLKKEEIARELSKPTFKMNYKKITIHERDKILIINSPTQSTSSPYIFNVSYPSFLLESWSPQGGYIIGESYIDAHEEIFLNNYFFVYKVLEVKEKEITLKWLDIHHPEGFTYDDKYVILSSGKLINLETFEIKITHVETGWWLGKIDYVENYDLYFFIQSVYLNSVQTKQLIIRHRDKNFELFFDECTYESFNFYLTKDFLNLEFHDSKNETKCYKISFVDIVDEIKDL